VTAVLRSFQLDGRFVKADSIHLTLKFLGQISAHRLGELDDALQGVARETQPFLLEVGQAGLFPGERNPKVVWIGVSPAKEIENLRQRVENRLEEVGFAREQRPFHPHLTLLRLKSRKNLNRLVQYVRNEGGEVHAGTMTVRGMHLYESVLRRDGPEYHSLVEARFQESESGSRRV